MTASDPRVGEIQARLAKVTPGPWKADNCGASCCVWVTSSDNPEGQLAGVDGIENAEFIAAAPADVRYLLAELRKAHEALARAGYRKTLPQEGGEGWYEFFAPVGTTHIAYVHANGEIYLPEEGWTDLTHDDWFAASVKGRVHKLVLAAVAAAKGDGG